MNCLCKDLIDLMLQCCVLFCKKSTNSKAKSHWNEKIPVFWSFCFDNMKDLIANLIVRRSRYTFIATNIAFETKPINGYSTQSINYFFSLAELTKLKPCQKFSFLKALCFNQSWFFLFIFIKLYCLSLSTIVLSLSLKY